MLSKADIKWITQQTVYKKLSIMALKTLENLWKEKNAIIRKWLCKMSETMGIKGETKVWIRGKWKKVFLSFFSFPLYSLFVWWIESKKYIMLLNNQEEIFF